MTYFWYYVEFEVAYNRSAIHQCKKLITDLQTFYLILYSFLGNFKYGLGQFTNKVCTHIFRYSKDCHNYSVKKRHAYINSPFALPLQPYSCDKDFKCCFKCSKTLQVSIFYGVTKPGSILCGICQLRFDHKVA